MKTFEEWQDLYAEDCKAMYDATPEIQQEKWDVFVKHNRIYFSVGNQSFPLAYEPEDEPEMSKGQAAEWYMDQLRHALSRLQSPNAQVEIAKRDARIHELALDWQVQAERIKECEDDVEKWKGIASQIRTDWMPANEKLARERDALAAQNQKLRDLLNHFRDDTESAVLAKIKVQGPAAWLHCERKDSDVVTDVVKHVWGKVAVGSLALYDIPLYRLPEGD